MHTIKYNTSIVVLDKFIKNVGVNKKYENELTGKYADALYQDDVSGTKGAVPFRRQPAESGPWEMDGCRPDIFILDEPTRRRRWREG